MNDVIFNIKQLALRIKEFFWFLGKESPGEGRVGIALAWELASGFTEFRPIRKPGWLARAWERFKNE